jgi:hypothetical protein
MALSNIISPNFLNDLDAIKALNLTGIRYLSGISGELAGLNVTISNPILAVSGVFSTTIGNVAVTGGSIQTIVTGSISTAISAVAITGAPVVTITGVLPVSIAFLPTQNVAVTGGSILTIVTGSISTQVTSVAVTGGNITVANPVLATSGISTILSLPTQNVAVTGGLIQTIVTGSVSASISSVAITGAPVVTITGVLATSASVVVGNIAVTGGSVGISNPVLAISGVVSTSVGSVAVTGGTFTVANPILAVSGIFTASVGNVAVTGGSIQTIVTGSVSATVPNPIGITGTSIDTGLGINTRFVPVGGRAVAISGVGSLSIYNTGDPVAFNFNKDNGALLVNQGNLDYTQDTVSASISGGYVGITGAPVVTITGVLATSTSVTVGNVAVTGGSIQTITTGSLNVTMGNVAVTGGNINVAVTGASIGFNLTSMTSGQVQIPAGAISWFIAIESGQSYINGVYVNAQQSLNGLGYDGHQKLSSAINVGCTGGRVLVSWEI